MTPLFTLVVICFAGCVGLHWLFVRVIAGKDFVRNGYFFICAAGAALAPAALRLGLSGLFCFYLTLTILWNLYTIFFINLMNSVSLRMMVEIANSPAGALSKEELLALYSDEEAFASRLRGLVAAGLLERSPGELALTNRGGRLARALTAIRKLFGIEVYG